MSIVPWKTKRNDLNRPQHSVDRLRNEMDSLFERFFHDPFRMEFSKEIENTTGWWPQLDLSETDKDVLIKAELPGIDPKEVDISINGNQLSIRGEKKLEHEEKKSNYHYVERQYGSFSRSVNLPCAVLQDKVDANYKDGVLTITLPKDAAHQPKRITVHNG